MKVLKFDENSPSDRLCIPFENPKQIHLAIIGHGTVGRTLINQILNSTQDIINRDNTRIKSFLSEILEL